MDILLVDHLVPEAQAWLGERHTVHFRPELADDASALRKAIYKVDALVLPRGVAATRELLDFAPCLKVLGRMHAGTDNTDLQACRERKVRVVQAATANVRATAEFLLTSLLLLYRSNLSDALAGRAAPSGAVGRELHGSTVGILGLAPAAHVLAGMLQALGVKLIGYDPAVHHSSGMWTRLNIQPVSLRELVARADAVSAQVIYATRYRGFVNANLLAHCKPRQLWVSTNRADLFDPQALAAALDDGRIAAMVLDRAATDPAIKGTALETARNLLCTPRLGAQTVEARLRGSWYVAHRMHEALTMPLGALDSAPSQPNSLDDLLVG